MTPRLRPLPLLCLLAACPSSQSGPPLGEATPRVSVGPGAAESQIRQVVRTLAGRVYIAAADDDGGLASNFAGTTTLRMYRATAVGVPSAFQEADAASAQRPRVGPGRTLSGGDARLDPEGLIHTVYFRGDTGATLHQTFDTRSDQWGPPEELPGTRALAGPGGRFGARGSTVNALTFDLGGALYVAVAGPAALRVYRKAPGGAWAVDGELSNTTCVHPTLSGDRQGRVHLAWLEDDERVRYALRAGAWQTPETVAEGNPQVLSNGNLDQGPSLAVDQADRPLVLFLSGTPGSPTDNLARLRLRLAAGDWQAEDPAVYTHTPGLYLRGDDRFVLLGHDAAIHPGYLTRRGGAPWSQTALFQPTGLFDGSAAARFDPLYDTDCSVVDVVYFDEDSDAPGRQGAFKPDLFYSAIRLSGASSGSGACREIKK